MKPNSFESIEANVPTKTGTVRISYLSCSALKARGFQNAFSTRMGGVSPMPQDSLHLSPKNDSAENYSENLRRFLAAIGTPDWDLTTANQIHSDIRLTPEEDDAREGDALLSQNRGTLIGIKTADCGPILIGDPKTGMMAAVHAGWKGTLGRIVEKTIADLNEKFRVDPKSCVAAIGPSACGKCYEVGPEVAEQFRNEFRAWDEFMKLEPEKEKANLDVASANRRQLLEAGLLAANIHLSSQCTMHQNELYFSHRREHGHGRLLSVIGKI